MDRFAEAPIITGAKIVCDEMNMTILLKAAQRLNQQVQFYCSLDHMHHAVVASEIQIRLWNLNTTTTNDSLGILPLFQGMKVMLTENITIGNFLVNGAEGTVHSVLYHIASLDRCFAKVCYIHVPNCGIQLAGFPADVAPIIPTSKTFRYRGRFSISRLQLPLLPAYSYTDYKSQGRSLSFAFVDLASAKSLQGAYVMLSRVKELSGLAILRDFKDKLIEQDLSSDLHKELSRLDELDAATKELCLATDGALLTDDPMDWEP
jgi:hypothetical protein